MYQRQLCPSVGAILRPLTHNTAAASNGRCLHISARRCAENGSTGSTPAAAPKSSDLESRRTRMRAAVSQIANLKSTSPQGIRRPLIRRTGGPAPGTSPAGATAAAGAGAGAAKPPGTMIRAPSTLRITRTPMDFPRSGPSGPRGPRGPAGARPAGPNLQGRVRRTGPPSAGGNRTGSGGPKRRPPKPAGARVEAGEEKVEDTLSDGMVQQLLRLQRKMWDRTPYEPKYAPGSAAAKELVEAGNKLFAGEVKKVKKPGMLERRIGVVGMHGT